MHDIPKSTNTHLKGPGCPNHSTIVAPVIKVDTMRSEENDWAVARDVLHKARGNMHEARLALNLTE